MEQVSTAKNLATRRPRWQYPPAQPTPRILNLPSRPSRKAKSKVNAVKPSLQRDGRAKLEALFDQEREFSRGVMPTVMVSGEGDDRWEDGERRERVDEGDSVMVEEEKWKFQAELLMAECNLLRTEREIAVKKMERRRDHIERTLKSAVQILLSGRKTISDGNSAGLVLAKEIQALVEKLLKLQRRSGNEELNVRKCSNFDRQASLLQRQLDKFGGESEDICVKEIQVMSEATLSINAISSVDENSVSNHSSNMEILRKKMERLSKETLLEKMGDEYVSSLSTANSSDASSTSISKQKDIHHDLPLSLTRQTYQEIKPYNETACSGHCKAVAQRVIDQVRGETEQWTQMQEMLGQVRDEIEELQASRDFWEDRALDSDYQIQSLKSDVQEWRRKAVSSEAKANELQAHVSALRAELQRLLKEKVAETGTGKSSPPFSLDPLDEMEKRVLVCRLKENCHANDNDCEQEVAFYGQRRKLYTCSSGPNIEKRSPFRDIENSLPLARQNSKGFLSLQRSMHSDVEKNF